MLIQTPKEPIFPLSADEKKMLGRYLMTPDQKEAGDYEWETDEALSRRVTFLGRSIVDCDILVVSIENVEKKQWVLATGCSTYDGHIVGTDIYIRRRIRIPIPDLIKSKRNRAA